MIHGELEAGTLIKVTGGDDTGELGLIVTNDDHPLPYSYRLFNGGLTHSDGEWFEVVSEEENQMRSTLAEIKGELAYGASQQEWNHIVSQCERLVRQARDARAAASDGSNRLTGESD